MADQAAQVDDWRDSAFYSVHRTHQLHLRLPDVLRHVVRVQRLDQSEAFSNRLVRRVVAHPDADHSCHPYEQDPVHRESGELAADRDLPEHRGDGLLADGLAAGQHARICPPSATVLAAPRDHDAGLCGSHSGRESLVCSQVWEVERTEKRDGMSNKKIWFITP